MFKNSRRIAQGQSASKHTEEAAAFDSCSAYHTSPEILFLSHCVPNPPDKGERIRSFHELQFLAKRFRVHLVCFAKSTSELEHAHALLDTCASVRVHVVSNAKALVRAMIGFSAGECLSTSYYEVPEIRQYIRDLVQDRPVSATFCYSSAVTGYAPSHLPLITDFVDIDSEKWLQYGNIRRLSLLYTLVGRRMRRVEEEVANRSKYSFITTGQELALLRSIAPDAVADAFENGVDFSYFDPALIGGNTPNSDQSIVFTGAMNYYPNAQAVLAFARDIYPVLRCSYPTLRFVIVGRDPSPSVRKLEEFPGITVTGAVDDIRPYIASSTAVVAPLAIARGIQNKVLEALAMGKPALCSPAVCSTFGSSLPHGITPCATAEDYVASFTRLRMNVHKEWPDIRQSARQRFSWENNLRPLSDAIDSAIQARFGQTMAPSV